MCVIFPETPAMTFWLKYGNQEKGDLNLMWIGTQVPIP